MRENIEHLKKEYQKRGSWDVVLLIVLREGPSPLQVKEADVLGNPLIQISTLTQTSGSGAAPKRMHVNHRGTFVCTHVLVVIMLNELGS